MSRLKWDQTGEKKFEAGVDHAVYYPLNTSGEYTPGVVWNGIISVAESPEGAEPESSYADNIKYLTMMSAEELNGTIEAYFYPPEFAQSNGESEVAKGVTIGQQSRKPFGLSYRTKIGDDVNGQDAGYKLHLLYGAQCSPSERTYETLNESPEPTSMSWEYSTTPVGVTGHSPTSLVTIDSTLVDPAALARLEDILYGSDESTVDEVEGSGSSAARLPLPDEIIAIIGGGSESEVMRARMNSMVQTQAVQMR